MKNKIYILIVLLIVSLPFVVYGSGSISVSSSNISMKIGETKTFTIKANNAAGRVDIFSNNKNIATVSKSNAFLDMNSITVKVTAKSVGTTKIEIKLTDVATYDSEVLSGTKTINITVSEAKKNNDSNKNSSNNKPTDNPVVEKKEMVIKRFDVIGYDINFNKDIYEYNISVSKDVLKLYIIVDGDNFTVSNDKEVDIENKEEIIVTLKDDINTKNYKLKINRDEPSPIIEKDIKCSENKIILYAMIFFELLSFCLIIVLIKLIRRKNI